MIIFLNSRTCPTFYPLRVTFNVAERSGLEFLVSLVSFDVNKILKTKSVCDVSENPQFVNSCVFKMPENVKLHLYI